MRTQIEIGHSDINEEREARKAAEEEAGHLRADLAALLGLANTEEMQSEIRLRAIHARENFQRKERSEIEELKEALMRSLEELESARAAEAVAEERASKANLQAAMYERVRTVCFLDCPLQKGCEYSTYVLLLINFRKSFQ